MHLERNEQTEALMELRNIVQNDRYPYGPEGDPWGCCGRSLSGRRRRPAEALRAAEQGSLQQATVGAKGRSGKLTERHHGLRIATQALDFVAREG
jgi:hypothetical protein